MKVTQNNAPVCIQNFGYFIICFYILWSSKEIARLSNDVVVLRKSVQDILIDGHIPVQNTREHDPMHKNVQDDDDTENKASDDQYFRHKRFADKDKKKCKKEKRYLRKCRKKLRNKAIVSSKEAALQAAHVELDFRINTTMSKKLLMAIDKCYKEFGGLVCYNNKTYESDSRQSEKTLSVPWKLSSPKEMSPLELTSEHGKYKVKYDGLYLVYLNILFIPTNLEERAAIFLDDKQIMTCQDGVYMGHELDLADRQQNFTEKSCATLGTFIINKGQTLSIRIETQSTKLRLWGVGNNFGVILLHKK
ncbi:unnamed protein product [Mytilus edulis]|uniref:TNF family profile domain-containing protein n=2 Tax=Mytilus TaxID=6548 RepID=A0A8B6GPQ8_MYTGA|nr:unnamed protein product [Mytilus edulis]VDI66920.1 Hypothetical predicted protein [Mytilus galloprovincialis]